MTTDEKKIKRLAKFDLVIFEILYTMSKEGRILYFSEATFDRVKVMLNEIIEEEK